MCDSVNTERDGQIMLTRCAITGAEGIWSPTEAGTFMAWEESHAAAHARHDRDEMRQEMSRVLRRSALYIYRTTEPGDPLRRGIGPYL